MAFTDNIKEITPAIADIKNNTPVLIVDDKVLVGGIGGNFIPAGQGSGGGGGSSVDFYKCAAVYSDSTWSGYKYNVENMDLSQSTTTLQYTSAKAPVVGKLYNTEANIACDPFSPAGIVFYDRFNSQRMFPIAGETYQTNIYTKSYTQKYGVACVKLAQNTNNEWAMRSAVDTLIDAFTLSAFICFDSAWQNIKADGIIALQNTQHQDLFQLGFGMSSVYSGFRCYLYPYNIAVSSPLDATNWNHVIFRYDGAVEELYLNGQKIGDFSSTQSITSVSGIKIAYCRGTDVSIAELKLHNRPLSQTEITAQYNRLHAMITSN